MGKTFEFAFNIYGNLDSKFSAAFSSASNTMSNLQSNIKSMRSDIKILDNAYKNGTINVNSYKNAHTQMSATLDKTIAKQEKLGRAMNKLNNVKSKKAEMRSGIFDAAESALAVGAPVKMAMDMESAMADVKKVVDFDTPEQFKEMGNDIINLSKKIPMAADGLAQIVAAGGQSGIAKEDLTSFAESAAKMGVAFDISADEAGETMAKWRTAFKMNQSEVVELADKVNYLGNNTAASAPKISDVVRRIGPLGEVGGVASGEIAALGASMVGAGIESEVASTGIKNMILGLASGESATKSQAEAFGKLGLNASNMAKRMQTDAKGAIIDVLSRIKQLDKYEQASVLKDLFGSESLSAIAPLLGNLDNLQKNLDMVADKSKYTGSMETEFAARIETTEAKLQLAKNAAVAAGISLGNNLLPAVQSSAEWFAKGADALTGFTQQYPQLTKYIAYGTAAILAGNVAIFAMRYGWLAMKMPFLAANAGLQLMKINLTAANIQTSIATGKTYALGLAQKTTAGAQWAWNAAMSVGNGLLGIGKFVLYYGALAGGQIVLGTVTAAQWAWNVALNANPIGMVIIGIAGLVAAGVWMYKNWDDITAFCSLMWNNPMAAVDTFIAGLTDKFGGAFNWLGEKWDWVCSLFSTPIEANVQASAEGNGQRVSYDDVMHNANGGIYGKGTFLTTFAEESGESAIPHTPNSRNIGLLARTNEIMGNPLGGGGSNIAATFAPNITITGNADSGTVQQMQQVLNDTLADFEHKLKALQNQKARVSFD